MPYQEKQVFGDYEFHMILMRLDYDVNIYVQVLYIRIILLEMSSNKKQGFLF